MRQELLLRRADRARALDVRPLRTVRTDPYGWPMTDDATDRDEAGEDAVPQELDGGNAARHVAHVTGMSPDAAATYAAFHSGRWAQGPAGRRAA